MVNSDKIPAVLGVGNALMDIMTRLENDAILESFGLPRGSMTLVDAELSKKIYNSLSSNYKELTPGGSAANTIRALAAIGGNCGYLGRSGRPRGRCNAAQPGPARRHVCIRVVRFLWCGPKGALKVCLGAGTHGAACH